MRLLKLIDRWMNNDMEDWNADQWDHYWRHGEYPPKHLRTKDTASTERPS